MPKQRQKKMSRFLSRILQHPFYSALVVAIIAATLTPDFIDFATVKIKIATIYIFPCHT